MSVNKLASEKSAYLRQHAENPIHWWPYCEEALKKAKAEDRPIFLSIGYSSCHWCHVMAHESFEDQATADLLNGQFISIKVDREEHPHIDHLYQQVASVATGRGGWPLSVFLSPDLKPLFVGTYFPKEPRQGMPSFKEIVGHVENTFKTNRTKAEEEGRKLLEEIAKPIKLPKEVKFEGHFPSPAAIMNALQNYADKTNGGYGQAPKFPHFAFLEWTAEQILEGMIPQELGQHVVDTIEKMVMGGLYDHLKGGIHRYSTDDAWLVPHFEKMLYDQSGFLRVLAKVTPFYPAPLLYDALLQTLDYLDSEMVSDSGYFMAAQDADSEGHEGLYFSFAREEFVQTLQNAEGELGPYNAEWEKWFRITEKGNFGNGLNVISLDPAYKEAYYAPAGWEKVRKIRQVLLEERKQRIPPATDPKGIASWNLMLLSSLCDVIQYCRVPEIAQQAVHLLNRVLEGVNRTFVQPDAAGNQVLRHSTSTNSAPLYFEDYVSFIDAQFRLYEVTGTEVFLSNAKEALTFVRRQFFHDGGPMLVAGATDGSLRAPLNDQSFQSSKAILLLTTARLSLLAPEFHPEQFWGEQWNEGVQLTLVNPIAHGAALRAYTYPLEIIRKIEVPRAWIHEGDFQNLRSHFLGRFVLNYHDRTDDSWQICTRSTCEKQGKSLAGLIETFRAPTEEPHE